MHAAYRYELANHLGNVMVVVSGLKQGKDVNKDGKSDIYYAGSLSHRDYYPFGGLLAGRTALRNLQFRSPISGFAICI